MPPVYKLISVNTVPERAKRLIGRIVEDVKDRWTIHYVANAESASGSASLSRRYQNDAVNRRDRGGFAYTRTRAP